MVQIVTRDNLGDSFDFDNLNRKINVKVDDNTIGKNQQGALFLKTESSSFINAVRSAESITSLSTHIDPISNHRFIRYVNESGEEQEIDLSNFLADVQISGGVLDGQILKIGEGETQVVVDLSIFITEDELTQTLNGMFDEVAIDAFGSQLFRVKSL